MSNYYPTSDRRGTFKPRAVSSPSAARAKPMPTPDRPSAPNYSPFKEPTRRRRKTRVRRARPAPYLGQGVVGHADKWRRLRVLQGVRSARNPFALALKVADVAIDYIPNGEIVGDPLGAPPGWEFYYECDGGGVRPVSPPDAMRTYSGYHGFCGLNTSFSSLPINDTDPQLLLLKRFWFINRYNYDTHSVYNRIEGVPSRLPDHLYPDGEQNGPWGLARNPRNIPRFEDAPMVVPHYQTRPGLSAPNRLPIPIWALPISRPSRPPLRDQLPEDSSNGNGDPSKPPVVDPPTRLPEPPGKGVKERKAYSGVSKAVAAALDKATEVMDVIDVAWQSLDRDCVRRKGGKLNSRNKAQDVYRFASCINIEKFLRGLMANAIEDAIVGKLFSLDAARRAKLEEHFGYYPSAQRLIDIALAGGLPVEIQQIVDDIISAAVKTVSGGR